MTDICEKEDGAKEAPNMGGRGGRWLTPSGHFDSSV